LANPVWQDGIAEGLATAHNQRRHSETLKDKRIVSLDLAGLVAGTNIEANSKSA